MKRIREEDEEEIVEKFIKSDEDSEYFDTEVEEQFSEQDEQSLLLKILFALEFNTMRDVMIEYGAIWDFSLKFPSLWRAKIREAFLVSGRKLPEKVEDILVENLVCSDVIIDALTQEHGPTIRWNTNKEGYSIKFLAQPNNCLPTTIFRSKKKGILLLDLNEKVSKTVEGSEIRPINGLEELNFHPSLVSQFYAVENANLDRGIRFFGFEESENGGICIKRHSEIESALEETQNVLFFQSTSRILVFLEERILSIIDIVTLSRSNYEIGAEYVKFEAEFLTNESVGRIMLLDASGTKWMMLNTVEESEASSNHSYESVVPMFLRNYIWFLNSKGNNTIYDLASGKMVKESPEPCNSGFSWIGYLKCIDKYAMLSKKGVIYIGEFGVDGIFRKCGQYSTGRELLKVFQDENRVLLYFKNGVFSIEKNEIVL